MTTRTTRGRSKGGSEARRALVAAIGLALLAGCRPQSSGPPAGRGRGPAKVAVEVKPVESRRLEYVVRAIGGLEAFERVQVTARVPGGLDRVLFREGQLVEKGALLAEIEPARFRVAVEAAKAQLESAEVSLADAAAGLERRLLADKRSPGLIPAEEIEGFRIRQRLAQAAIAEAKARLAEAELNLADAHVRAPMAGVVETRGIETGQYVQPGTVITVLLRREPLLLRFRVPEADASGIAKGNAVSFTVGGSKELRAAQVTHVGSSADPSSRMVSILAEVRDAEGLRPGSFADVTLPIGAATAAPVIPEIAIRPTERGFLAFVVEGDRAKPRTLTLGMRTADGLVEVRSGLSPGEALVVRGAEALRDGVEVKVEGAAAPAPDAGPRGEL